MTLFERNVAVACRSRRGSYSIEVYFNTLKDAQNAHREILTGRLQRKGETTMPYTLTDDQYTELTQYPATVKAAFDDMVQRVTAKEAGLQSQIDALEPQITDAPKGTAVDLTQLRAAVASLVAEAQAVDPPAAPVASDAIAPASPNNDGKDAHGYPLGWLGSVPTPDAHPGAVPPAPGMMPGNPTPEQAVTPGATLGRDPNFSVTGEPATDPKDFAPADGGTSALAATGGDNGGDPNATPAAPDQQAEAAKAVQADAQDQAKQE